MAEKGFNFLRREERNKERREERREQRSKRYKMRISMDWVAPHLNEGLGNRLFQFAAAKGYAEKYKKQLIFFLPRCGKTNHGSFETIFQLFPEIPLIETAVEWNVLDEPEGTHFLYQPYEQKDTPLVISGYRQSYKYFKDINIIPNFDFIDTNRLENVYLKERTFFVHIRLGDFRILPHHQIDIAKYYANAVQQIPENVNVLVFSDEPDLVEGLLTISHTIVKEAEVETLYLMSRCIGGIVGNSTFSFWGAYFAHQRNAEFKAFFPSSMGQGLPPPTDYIPDWATVVQV